MELPHNKLPYFPRYEQSARLEKLHPLEPFLPLPGGEGRGEGER